MFLSDKFGTRELLNFFCILLISVPSCTKNLYSLQQMQPLTEGISLLLVLSSEFRVLSSEFIVNLTLSDFKARHFRYLLILFSSAKASLSSESMKISGTTTKDDLPAIIALDVPIVDSIVYRR